MIVFPASDVYDMSPMLRLHVDMFLQAQPHLYGIVVTICVSVLLYCTPTSRLVEYDISLSFNKCCFTLSQRSICDVIHLIFYEIFFCYRCVSHKTTTSSLYIMIGSNSSMVNIAQFIVMMF